MQIRSLFLVLIFVSLAVSLYSLIGKKFIINDSTEYLNLSKNLAEYNVHYAGDFSKEVDYRLYSKRTLGYPLYLIFQQNALARGISQFLIYVLLVILGLGLLQSVTTRPLASKAYIWFILFSPVLLFHVQFVLSDLLLAMVVLLGVCTIIEKRITNKTRLIVVSLLWTLALAIKPVMLPSIVLLPFVIGYFGFRLKTYSWYSVVPFSLLFLVLALNHKNTEVAEYSSISTINIAHYNAKLTIASKYGNDSAQNFTSSQSFAIPHTAESYKKYKNDLNDIATRAIQDNIGSYIKIQIIGMFKMLVDPGRWEIYTFFDQNTSDNSLTELLFAQKWSELKSKLFENKTLFLLFVLLLVFNILKAIGLLFSLFKPSKLSLLLLGIMLYFLAITGPIGAARFMLPATVFSIVLSVYGWNIVLEFFQKRSKS